MKNRNQHIAVSKLDNMIKEKFTSSYMNNSKWNKLILRLTDQFDSIYLTYKLIHSNEINGRIFDTPDFEPFFIEPILYKEIEWIEIPKQYEDWVNENNRKAGKKIYYQNLNVIKTEINNIGHFEIENKEDEIRFYGYRK
jgi:hypothetical protein